MKGEARTAVVTSLHLNLEVKTLLVEIDRDTQIPSGDHITSVKIWRSGSGYSLRCEDVEVSAPSLRCLVTRHLLPLAYPLQPHLVVVSPHRAVPPDHLTFTLHQLQTLASGRMILIQD